jgi:hypothetical protein
MLPKRRNGDRISRPAADQRATTYRAAEPAALRRHLG